MKITVEALIRAPIANIWSTYTKVVPQQRIEYARIGTVEFNEGADGVTVRSTFDAETEHPAEQQRFGWQSILNKFAQHVEASQ